MNVAEPPALKVIELGLMVRAGVGTFTLTVALDACEGDDESVTTTVSGTG